MRDPITADPADYLTLREAIRLIPGRPHIATIYRWIARGVRGVRLRTLAVGGVHYVTRADIADFLAGLNPDRTSSPPRQTIRQRQRAIEAAERELREAGI